METDVKFKIINEIKRNADYYIAIVMTSAGERKFIKSAISEDRKKIIKREFNNQMFLCGLAKSRDCGFIFLKPELDGDTIYYPDISEEVKWLGEREPEKKNFLPRVEPIEKYLDNFMRLEKVLHEIKFTDLSKEIQADWDERKQGFKENFSNNSKYLLEQGIISQAYKNIAQKTIDEYGDNWGYQHHDVLPWHIAEKADGQQILVDADWSGWSYKYFDFAYYILQLVGYAQAFADANNLLARAKAEFIADTNFDNILKANILYRSTKLAKELNEQHNNRNAADRVISYISGLYKIK